MTPAKIQVGAQPKGRVFRTGDGSSAPGWYLQFYVASELQTVGLFVGASAPANSAVAEAAAFLGCDPANVQIGGREWPLQARR